MYHTDMEQQYIEIGKRILELRKLRHMTQQKLAEAVGYETSTAISLIESGKRRVQLSELEKFAQELNTSSQYLLTGKEPVADISIALRAEKNLDKHQIEQVVDFIDFIKRDRKSDGGK